MRSQVRTDPTAVSPFAPSFPSLYTRAPCRIRSSSRLPRLVPRQRQCVDKSSVHRRRICFRSREFRLSPETLGTKFDVILIDPPWDEYAQRKISMARTRERYTRATVEAAGWSARLSCPCLRAGGVISQVIECSAFGVPLNLCGHSASLPLSAGVPERRRGVGLAGDPQPADRGAGGHAVLRVPLVRTLFYLKVSGSAHMRCQPGSRTRARANVSVGGRCRNGFGMPVSCLRAGVGRGRG